MKVSDIPFSLASLGKNGAIIDVEQKLMKSTNARDTNVIFWDRDRFLRLDVSTCPLALKYRNINKQKITTNPFYLFIIYYLNSLSWILLTSAVEKLSGTMHDKDLLLRNCLNTDCPDNVKLFWLEVVELLNSVAVFVYNLQGVNVSLSIFL